MRLSSNYKQDKTVSSKPELKIREGKIKEEEKEGNLAQEMYLLN